VCYLHSDISVSLYSTHPRLFSDILQLLPNRPSARVAWNCLLESREDPKYHAINSDGYKLIENEPKEFMKSKISITFDMNKLQAIPNPGEYGSPGRVLVIMNPIRAPRSPQSHQLYDHPLINSESMLVLRHLPKINRISAVSFAGAWM